MAYLVSPRQTFKAAVQGGCDHKQLQLSGVAVLTFSKAVMQRLEELCLLQEITWLSPSLHLYTGAQFVKRGDARRHAGYLPPMGASPLACIIEDLATGGVQAVFLVCAAGSPGPPVRFGDLMMPANPKGPDGTSTHYGNRTQQVHAEPEVVEALAQAAQAVGARVHVGGNATCEALYRITPEMVQDY